MAPSIRHHERRNRFYQPSAELCHLVQLSLSVVARERTTVNGADVVHRVSCPGCGFPGGVCALRPVLSGDPRSRQSLVPSRARDGIGSVLEACVKASSHGGLLQDHLLSGSLVFLDLPSGCFLPRRALPART